VSDVAVLSDLSRARRSRRLAEVDVFERLYQAYLTVIALAVVVLFAAAVVGDERVGASAVARVERDGAAVVGAVLAVAMVVGLRSGNRGGPLTLEAPFVAHVLLSPVARDRALRDPAVRQLGQALVGGATAGGIVGVVATHRLPLASLPVVLWAAVAGAAVAVAAAGAAMVVAGLPVPKPVVHLLCLALAAGSVVDVVAGTAWSPGSMAGRLALGGVDLDPVGLAVLPVAVALAAAGIAVVGGTSVEAARRRAGLVSQLRFAVTRQDLRTVVLLQRRLAQDAARRRPWVRIPSGRRAPVLRRGLRGLARLPLVRLVRVLVLASVAVLAALGVWRGTSPLVVVCGLALWAAALDVIEPLAQELDHPDRWAGYPVGHGDLLLRHLVAPFALLVAATLVPVAVAAALGDAGTVLGIAGGTVVPACAAAVAAAAASVATGPFDITAVQAFVPETVGTQLIARVVWPPAVAVLATLPLLAAPGAADDGLTELQATVRYLFPLAALVALVAVWLTRRKPGLT
jgi:hypothetical protein